MTPERVASIEELCHLDEGLRAVRRLHRRRVWRRAVQLRTARVAVVLRAVQRAMGATYLRREKGTDRRWSILGRQDESAEVLVALVGGGSTRTLEEVRSPVSVEVVAPSMLDLDALRRALGATPAATEQ